MKKTYMKPTQKVVKLRTMGMLMTSGAVSGTSVRMGWDDTAEDDEEGL